MNPFSTPRAKLNQVNNQLGVRAIATQQDTTRAVYDTVSGAALTYGQFFTNFAGKTAFEVNIDSNKLDSEESMVINEIIFSASAGTPFATATNLNVFVGDDVRVKDFNLQYAATDGFQEFPISSNNSGSLVSLPMLTSIVIPPQVSFRLTLELSEAAVYGADGIKVVMKGFGKIFKPNVSL